MDDEPTRAPRGLLNPAPREAAEPSYPLIMLDEAGELPMPGLPEELDRLISLGVVKLMVREVIGQGLGPDGRPTSEVIARYFYTDGGELEEIDRLDETRHLSIPQIIAARLGLAEAPDPPDPAAS